MELDLEFEYDEDKSTQCLRARGFDFAFVLAVFEDSSSVEFKSTGRDYDEIRFVRIGMIEGRLFTIVWTQRGDKIRIISARRSKRKERKRYGQNGDD